MNEGKYLVSNSIQCNIKHIVGRTGKQQTWYHLSQQVQEKQEEEDSLSQQWGGWHGPFTDGRQSRSVDPAGSGFYSYSEHRDCSTRFSMAISA